MSYISCSACAKTLLLFCVYEQRLCRVFAVYVIAMHVHWSDKAKNRSIYCITWVCRCAKAESCLRSVYVCDVYELQRVCYDSSYASSLIAMLMAMLMTMLMTILRAIVDRSPLEHRLVSKPTLFRLAYVLLSHIDSRPFPSRYFPSLAFIYSLHYTHMTRSMLASNII